MCIVEVRITGPFWNGGSLDIVRAHMAFVLGLLLGAGTGRREILESSLLRSMYVPYMKYEVCMYVYEVCMYRSMYVCMYVCIVFGTLF